MAYNSTIPKPTDQIKNSQGDLLGNFAALKPFGNGYADFTVQSVLPTIAVTDTGLYTKSLQIGILAANNEMYIQKQTNGNAIQSQIPFTASILSNTAASTGLSGWTYLPSGLLLKWGKLPVTTATPVFQNFNLEANSGGPNYATLFSIMISPYQTNNAPPPIVSAQLGSISPTVTQIAITNGSIANGTGVYYLMIGV